MVPGTGGMRVQTSQKALPQTGFGVYRRLTRYRILLIASLIFLCVVSLFFDIVTGPAMLSVQDVAYALFSPPG